MRHHLDEFSVTDVRHTLEEAWRIVRQRRWMFVFPFCIAMTAAMLCSFMVPRLYTARTIIKREHDPVFANMMGSSWTRPYVQIRERMDTDLRDPQAIAEVFEELDLPEGLERFEDGKLVPASAAARRALVDRTVEGLTIESLTTSPDRDVMAINLTTSDPKHAQNILRVIRDKYMATARARTVEVLHSAEEFFKGESERCRLELAVLHRRLVEYELKYPGINPDLSDPSRTEQTALVVERVDLERRLNDLRLKGQQLERRLAAATGSEVDLGPSAEQVVAVEPNPRYMELKQDINRLLREIAEKKTLRGMTDQHPDIRQLWITLAMRQDELTTTPREQWAVSEFADIGPIESGEPSLASQIEVQLADLEAKTAVHESRLAAIGDQIAGIDRRRAFAVEPRQDYLELKRKAQRLRAELESWQQNLGPIQRIFLVEDRDRTIHFATVQDVAAVTRPSSPNANLVVVVCVIIGVAIGALFVLLSEFLDRSYRTVKHLKTSLGLPVVESIDEIVTQAVLRRRLVRGLVLRPAAALICVSAMVVAGTMAYLSIERPAKYELLKAAPLRAYQSFIGRS
jgi:uncharacterized protein involved in exopolysaccharide biosynthesis